jgi:hypothetical protein
MCGVLTLYEHICEHIFEFILYLFAAYGFFVFLHDLLKAPGSGRYGKGIRIFLSVKDCEDNIEGAVRTLLASGIPQKFTEDRGIMVVDCGSSDKTKEILNRLEKRLDNLYLA